MASAYNSVPNDSIILNLHLLSAKMEKEPLLQRLSALSATMRNQYPSLVERRSFVTPYLDALFNEDQVRHCVSVAMAFFQAEVDKHAKECAKENITAGKRLCHTFLSRLLRPCTNYGVIKSHSEKLLAWLTGSRVLVVDLPDEILASILELLVDCDRKVYDSEKSDILGSSSTRRALELSSVCRQFRSLILHMPGAWAVVTPRHPGRAFLTICAKRSIDKGIRVFLETYFDSSVMKLVRNLVLDRSICNIKSISTGVSFFWWPGTRHEEDKVIRLLGKLNNSTLNAVNIRYTRNFKFVSNVVVDNEQVEEAQADDDDSDDSGNEDSESSYFTRKASYELQPLLCSPALRSASFENTIPLAGLMHSITKLSIAFNQHYFSDDKKWDVQDLINLLRSQSTIGDFTLEFCESRTFRFENIVGNVLPVELPFLNTLDLHWRSPQGFFAPSLHTSHDIPRLFGLLNLKNLKVFRFKLSREDEDSGDGEEHSMPFLLDDHLSFFLSSDHGGRFPLLESFHLELFSTLSLAFLPNIRLPPSLIQNIKHLSLHINIGLSLCDHNRNYEEVPGALPHLQTLTLRNCDMFTTETVRSIIDAIKRGGNWDDFQWLSVDECRYLSRRSLKKIVESWKFEVYPNTRSFMDV